MENNLTKLSHHSMACPHTPGTASNPYLDIRHCETSQNHCYDTGTSCSFHPVTAAPWCLSHVSSMLSTRCRSPFAFVARSPRRALRMSRMDIEMSKISFRMSRSNFVSIHSYVTLLCICPTSHHIHPARKTKPVKQSPNPQIRIFQSCST